MAALEKSKTVTTLVLQGNRLPFVLLVNMLCINKTIKTLNLPNNSLDNDDVSLLVENLNTFHLENLDLRFNSFENVADQLLLAVSKNKTLKSLAVSYPNLNQYELGPLLVSNKVLLLLEIGCEIKDAFLLSVLNRNRAIAACRVLLGIRKFRQVSFSKNVNQDVAKVIVSMVLEESERRMREKWLADNPCSLYDSDGDSWYDSDGDSYG